MNRSEAILKMLVGHKIRHVSFIPNAYLYFNGSTFMYSSGTDDSVEVTSSGSLRRDTEYRVMGSMAPKFKPLPVTGGNLTKDQKHVLSKYDIDKEDMDILEGR